MAEMICAQWPEFDVDCDIRCYGMDGELWCCNECGSAGVVRRLTIHTAARSVTLRGALAGGRRAGCVSYHLLAARGTGGKERLYDIAPREPTKRYVATLHDSSVNIR